MKNRFADGHASRLKRENDRLRGRLAETEETLRAISEGDVDAVVVNGRHGRKIYSLQDAENLYRRLAETIREPTLALDAEGNIVFFNERAQELLGLTADRISGHSMAELVHGDDWHGFHRMLRRAGRLGTAQGRARLKSAQGGSYPVFWRANSLERDEGNLICLVGTDLSQLEASRLRVEHLREQREELLAAQVELEASRERYAQLYNYAPVGYLTLDRNGTILRSNFTTATMLGLKSDRLAGFPLLVYVAAADRRLFQKHLWRSRHEAGPITSELRFKVKGGPELVAQMTSVRSRDAFENTARFRVTLSDITSRRLAEAALQEKTSELQRIADTSAVMLTRCSRDMRYLFVNGAAALALGSTPEDIVGKPIQQVMGEPAYREILPHARRVLKGHIVEFEAEIDYRGGRRFVHAIYVPDRDGRGKVTGWVAAITDITERKQAERWLDIRDAVNANLASATSVQEAVPGILEAICGKTGCDAGALWLEDPDDHQLRCLDFWHCASSPMKEFAEEMRRRRFGRGEGLVGRVWSTGKPIALGDPASQRGYARAEIARKSGFHSGFCAPLKLGKEVLGVMEGYSRKPWQADPGFFHMLTAVSDKLGQFIKRKEAEESLRQNVERLRRILNTSLDAIITVNAKGLITGWNPQAEHIFGWPRKEALGRKLAGTVVPRRYRKTYEENLRHYLATGEGAMLEKRIELTALHRSGREFPVELAITPFMLDGFLAFSAFVRDISERKASEEMLRRAHDELEQRVRERTAELADANAKLQSALARMNDLYHRAPCGYHSLDATGRFVEINDTALQWLGYTREELVDKKAVFDIETPASRKAGLDAFRKLKRGEQIRDLQLEFTRRDGSVMAVSLNATPIMDGAGRMIRSRSAYVDVTERIQAEQALGRSEARLQAILDFSPAVIFMKDLQGRYVLVNRRFERSFGMKRAQVIGRTDEELFPPEVAAVFRANDRAILRTARAKAFEEVAPYSDGNHVNIVVKFPLRGGPHGRVNALGGMAIDITARKQAETALRKSGERYQELFKEAQVARREMQRLSSLVLQAHEKERQHISRELHDDIGQVLTAVSMTLSGVKPNGDGGGTNQLKIAESQRLVQGVMATLHDFARELRPSVLDELGLLPAIRSTIHTLEQQTALRVLLSGDPQVETLRSELKLVIFRIVQESLNNVARYSKANLAEVELVRTGNSVHLTVADDGKSPGSNQRGAARGHRLGLLGMKERARLVSGKVTVRARPGKGTIVSVEIPLKSAATRASRQLSTPAKLVLPDKTP